MSRFTAEDTVQRVEAHPFDAPGAAYGFAAGRAPLATLPYALRGRTPVLAMGVHAGPGLAARRSQADAPALVTRAVLAHYAVVHAAEFAADGSLAPILQRHRGAMSYLFVSWLMPDELERLHVSEGVDLAADYLVLHDLKLEDEVAGLIGEAGVHLRRAGALVHRNRPVRVAEVPTTGCTLPALTQHATARLAHRLVGGAHEDYPEFVARLVCEPEFRAATNALLARHGKPLAG